MLIQNYHWNFAKGATPGTIALRDGTDRTYGLWRTEGSPGQGGVLNAYWTARTMLELPAGSYTVIDSDPGIWAQYSQSGGKGFTRVETLPVGSAVPDDGKALTTGQKSLEGKRWVNASNPDHYLDRKITVKGVCRMEHDSGKVLFEFSRGGRTLGSHQGGWK
jgi:hypothetical protein